MSTLSGGLGRHHATDGFLFRMRYEAQIMNLESSGNAACAPWKTWGEVAWKQKTWWKQKKGGMRHGKFMLWVNLSKDSYRFICFEEISYFNGKVLLTVQYEQAGDIWNFPSYKEGSQKALEIPNSTAFSLCFPLFKNSEEPQTGFHAVTCWSKDIPQFIYQPFTSSWPSPAPLMLQGMNQTILSRNWNQKQAFLSKTALTFESSYYTTW